MVAEVVDVSAERAKGRRGRRKRTKLPTANARLSLILVLQPLPPNPGHTNTTLIPPQPALLLPLVLIPVIANPCATSPSRAHRVEHRQSRRHLLALLLQLGPADVILRVVEIVEAGLSAPPDDEGDGGQQDDALSIRRSQRTAEEKGRRASRTPTTPPTMPQVLPVLDEPLLLAGADGRELELAEVRVLVEPSELMEMEVTVTITAEAAGAEREVSFQLRRRQTENSPRVDDAGVVVVLTAAVVVVSGSGGGVMVVEEVVGAATARGQRVSGLFAAEASRWNLAGA